MQYLASVLGKVGERGVNVPATPTNVNGTIFKSLPSFGPTPKARADSMMSSTATVVMKCTEQNNAYRLHAFLTNGESAEVGFCG
jgi:hypothetical protein